jgi:threonine dehydrogenase-like Zn-dependent dehydrogenase
MGKLETYKHPGEPTQETYEAWQVFGAGIENVGRDGKPTTQPLREPKDDEVLVRIDVLGLCLSDMKIIKLGGDHPRLRGRDLANDPTVLGHECACTVVKVGKQWQDKFKPGDRCIVQADIYVNGVSYAFGYTIPGGLAEYSYLDPRALDGDEGCYLLPVKDDTGYSQSALAEPWACVEMSYCLEERLTLKEGGKRLLLLADSGDGAAYSQGAGEALTVPRSLEGMPEDDDFDDIIVEMPTPAIVNAVAQRLAKNGNLWLLGAAEEDGLVQLDVGAIHYENQRVFGGGGTLEEVARANARNDLKPGGTSLFIGAGGPMGQMHVQRAIEIEKSSGTVVVTDLDQGRLDHIGHRFGHMAEEKGVNLHLVCVKDYPTTEALDAYLKEFAPGGYDDVCVLVPVPALCTEGVSLAGANAFVNIFAGVPAGTLAHIPLGALCKGAKLIGCSGSRISDLRRILAMVESGQLDTNRSVAAIGGLRAAHEGLQGVRDAKYPGKTVIYTQISDLPLMALEEIKDKVPGLEEKLSPEGGWTKEAEVALLERFLS